LDFITLLEEGKKAEQGPTVLNEGMVPALFDTKGKQGHINAVEAIS
jgi:hypothetical protein